MALTNNDLPKLVELLNLIDIRMKQRGRTAAEWAAGNEVLKAREFGLETDTGKAKIGDGATGWNDLRYWYGMPATSTSTPAKGQVLAYDDTTHELHWIDPGKTYQAGAGIEIENPDSAAPIIKSTLGGISPSNRVDVYVDLPSPPPEGTGAAYFVTADGMIYIWNGSAWPPQGSGAMISSGGQPGVMTALLHMDGASGSTSFPNETGYGDGVASGGATISTARSKFGGASLLIGTANNSGLTLPASPLWGLHQNFWIECFVFIDTSISFGGDGLQMFFSTRPLVGDANNNSYNFGFLRSGADHLLSFSGYSSSENVWTLQQQPVVPTDAWVHVAVAVRSGILRGFIDGSRATEVVLPPIAADANEAHVGFMTPAPDGGSRSLCGSLDELRVITGGAPHWDDFTPPTAPYSDP